MDGQVTTISYTSTYISSIKENFDLGSSIKDVISKWAIFDPLPFVFRIFYWNGVYLLSHFWDTPSLPHKTTSYMNGPWYIQHLAMDSPSYVAEKYMANFFEEQQGECWIEASNFWNCTWCFGKIPIMLLVFRPYYIELTKTSFLKKSFKHADEFLRLLCCDTKMKSD